MKLGILIRNYRESHDISQRQFANICGLSNGYISILEKGINPNTGKPVTPTIPQLKKLADGMGITLTELMDSADDMPINIACSSDYDPPEPFQSLITHSNLLRIFVSDGTFEDYILSDDQLDEIKTILHRFQSTSIG